MSWKQWSMMKWLALAFFAVILVFGSRHPAQTAPTTKPMILPMATPPSPESWFMGQPYGNTTGAYNFGSQWYEAGQRLHFGMDFSMPCGTPLVAVADGEVHGVDSMSFGSAPHNVILRHPDLGLSTLYGHLLERSTLIVGQPVKQGDIVGLSGDPDGVCDSRPHLHLEIRSADFRTTYNPVDYIEAPWHTLALLGPFSQPMFQQDMDNPRRWMSLTDQPEVVFGGPPLNNYNSTFPYSLDIRPPRNAPMARELDPLPANTTWAVRQIGFDGCCAYPWWDATDSNTFYVIDGVAGQRASVFEWAVDFSRQPTPIEEAPPMLLSPDGTHQVTRVNGQITIRNLTDNTEWAVLTQGALPAISPDNSRLLWEVWRGNYLPGEPAQTVETWVSDINGNNARQIWLQAGGWAVWLDEARVLVVSPVVDSRETTLSIFDTRTDTSFTLGTWNELRGLDVAPKGERLMFWLNWQPEGSLNGMYSLLTAEGAIPEKMPWFGAWKWRDSDSVYYIPFDFNAGQQHILAYYDLTTGEDRYLTDPTTTPFTIANADWTVSPDGNRILFRHGRDLSLWVLEIRPE